MRLPDFLLIGAAKSGTTALFHYLSQHPEVFACPVREPNFFALEGHALDFAGPGDRETVGLNSVTHLQDYARLFEDAVSRQIVGEVSPLYLYSPEAPAQIKLHIPEVKLIAILRHPVDRAYASYLHLKRDRREPCDTFSDAFSKEEDRIKSGWEHLWHYYQMGRYILQLQRYMSQFEKKQIKVFLYEDFEKQPAEVLSQCFDFLGIDAGFSPDFSRRPNRSGIPRSNFVQKAMSGDSIIKRAVAKYMPEKIKGKMVLQLQQLNLSRPEVDAALRRTILDRYREEIILLQGLIEQDLSHWLED